MHNVVLNPLEHYTLNPLTACHMLSHKLTSGQIISATLANNVVSYSITTRAGDVRTISGEHFESFAIRTVSKLIKSTFTDEYGIYEAYFTHPGNTPYFMKASLTSFPKDIPERKILHTISAQEMDQYTDDLLCEPSYAVNKIKEIINGKKTHVTS